MATLDELAAAARAAKGGGGAAPAPAPAPAGASVRPGALSLGDLASRAAAAKQAAMTPTDRQAVATGNQQAAVRKDLTSLLSGRPDDVKNWRDLGQLVVRLKSTTADQTAQDTANALMWTYGAQLKPHVDAIDKTFWATNYTPPPKQKRPWYGPVLHAAGAIGDYLGQWGQAGLGAVAGLETAINQDDNISAKEGLLHAGRSLLHAGDITAAVPGTVPVVGGGLMRKLDPHYNPGKIRASDGGHIIIDRTGEGQLNLREALGRDPHAGLTLRGPGGIGTGYEIPYTRKLMGLFDTAGAMGVDPLTYVMSGESGLARVGMRGAEDVAEQIGVRGLTRSTVKEMNQRIARFGVEKGLTKAEQQLYETLVRAAVQKAEAGGAKTVTRFGRDLAEEQFKAIRQGGQEGLRLAGKTVLPTGRVKDALRTAHVIQDVEYARPLENRLSLASTRRAIGEAADEIQRIVKEVPVEDWAKAGQESTAALGQVSMVARSAGLMGKIIDTKAGSVLRSVKPWLRFQVFHGKEATEALNSLASATLANADHLADEVETRLGTKLDILNKKSVMTQSVKEFESPDAWSAAMNRALADPDQFEAVMAEAGPHTQQMLEALDDVRQDIYGVTLKAKGYTEEQIAKIASGELPLPEDMHDINTYVPRIITGAVRNNEEVLQQLRNLSGVTEIGGLQAGDHAALGPKSLRQRTLFPEIENVEQLNQDVAGMLKAHGVTDPGQVFESNMPAVWALHSKEVFASAADYDLLDGIAREMGTTKGGAPFALRVDPSAEPVLGRGGKELTPTQYAERELKRAGGDKAQYRMLPTDSGAYYFVHEDIAKELEGIRRIFGQPREMGKLARFIDSTNRVWAASATIGLLNPGFHARNELGNLTSMYYAGVRNPTVILHAARLQKAFAAIQEIMREQGRTYADAVAEIGLKPRDAKILDGALREGIMEGGRSADMLRSVVRGERSATRLTVRNAINPADSGSMLNITGARMGESIEHNARLSVYIDQLNKGASPRIAGQQVKKFLFDYGDLTRFEKETVRTVSRFYTFTRKNLGLQMYMLAHYPGGVNQAFQAAQGMAALIPLPGFDAALGGGDFGAPDYLNNPILRRTGKTNVALSVDTPLAQAAETATILPRLAALVQGDRLGPLDREGPGSRLADSATALLSGFPIAALDFAHEATSGRDSFTGRPLGKEGRDSALFRLVETALPSLQRIEGQGSQFGMTREGKNQQDATVTLAHMFLGLNSVEVGADTDGTARWLLLDYINKHVLPTVAKAGVEVPTIDELREAGKLDAKDRVTEALMYSWLPTHDEAGRVTGYEWSDDARRRMLLSIVPKDIRDLFGPKAALKEGEEMGTSKGGRHDKGEHAYDAFDFEQAVRAIEAWRGKKLTPEEATQVVLASPWAPANTQLQEQGLQPVYDYETDTTANRFAPDDVKKKTYEQKLAEANEQLDRLAKVVGLDQDQMRAMRPRLSDFARMLDEAKRVGITGSALVDYVIRGSDEGGGGVLSRADKAAINQLYGGGPMNGPVPITQGRHPELSAEDVRKAQTKAWQADQEFQLFARLYGLPTPTQQQRERYVLNTLMTKKDEKMLGIPPLKGAKNRKDVRSTPEKVNDARAQVLAGRTGILKGPGGAGSGEWYESQFALDPED